MFIKKQNIMRGRKNRKVLIVQDRASNILVLP